MELNEFLQSILYAVITAVVPVLSVYAVRYLKELREKNLIEKDDTIAQRAINDALDLVAQVVTSTSQTYVDSLKEYGRFDEDSQLQAFESTKNTILLLLSEKSKEMIKTLHSDLDTWIDVQIEAAVKALKMEEGE